MLILSLPQCKKNKNNYLIYNGYDDGPFRDHVTFVVPVKTVILETSKILPKSTKTSTSFA